MKQPFQTLTGVALALAAAGLATGCQGTGGTASASSTTNTTSAKVDLVECHGVNVCAGHNDCKTADNKCAGHASCKGQGWLAMPAGACKDVGGKVVDEPHGTIAKADLVHCFGVNTCKGHNDCKTAENACKGHSECKGSGFVATPEKACKDMGGEVG